MTLAEQIQIVEDNLKEYGVCDITIEEFNYLKDELYSSGCLAGIELGRADAITELLETQKHDELSQKIAIDILERGIAKGRADAEVEHKEMCETCIHKVSAEDIKQIRNDALVEFVTRFEYKNITDANAERLKPFIYEMHRLSEQMQKGAE